MTTSSPAPSGHPVPDARRHITISGYYGFDNTGDEAILQATIAGIRRHIPDVSMTVLSANPESTAASTGVKAVHRYRRLPAGIKRNGLFVSGGGGLFQDVTTRRSLVYYLGVLSLARIMGMKTMVYAQGLGPLNRPSSQRLVGRVLKRVDRITVRDPASAALLARLGLAHKTVVTADPAFTLEPASQDRAVEILGIEGVPAGKSLLGVALRPWNEFNDEGRRLLADQLSRIADERGVHIVLIPMHSPGDGTASKQLASLMNGNCTIIANRYAPGEIAALLGNCKAVAAMRLHAIILASLSGVPSVALSYDPKVNAAAQQLGLPPALDVRSLSADPLANALRQAIDLPVDGRKELLEAAHRQQRLAETNFEIIGQTMGA